MPMAKNIITNSGVGYINDVGFLGFETIINKLQYYSSKFISANEPNILLLILIILGTLISLLNKNEKLVYLLVVFSITFGSILFLFC